VLVMNRVKLVTSYMKETWTSRVLAEARLKKPARHRHMTHEKIMKLVTKLS
jgi:hypothetical protein